MGCRFTKSLLAIGDECRREADPSSSAASGANDSSSSNRQQQQYPEQAAMSAKELKARLERLMCVARETPEPVFELSACDLRAVPAGVFILCKVLRKERLDLSANRLRSLADGGDLLDLRLLTHLDLSGNALKVLPPELTQLANLQELRLQNNRLTQLPVRLSDLRRLEHLDVADNQLADIAACSCVPQLRVLNVAGNPRLLRLPMELSTCLALTDVLCDWERLLDPPREVWERGTRAVLAYLMGNTEAWRELEPVVAEVEVAEEASEVQTERGDETEQRVAVAEEEEEEDIIDAISKQLQAEQQRNREVLLQQLLQQQGESDALVSELQLKRDVERTRLIEDIANAEATSSSAVDRLLSLRTNASHGQFDADLSSQLQQQQQFTLLDQLRAQQDADLQRTKVLAEMRQQLSREHQQIAAYSVRRDRDRDQLLLRLEADEQRLLEVCGSTEAERSDVLEQILSDDELQRGAVAALIERSDGQSWALVEQVRMIEAQLVRMTREELRRREVSASDQMNKLCEQRMDLTGLLAALISQQDERKQQLLAHLLRMESEQQERNEDFWLLQYQKLLDARTAAEAADASADRSLDPRLGLQLLNNGVIHLLPFLARLLRPAKSGADLRRIGDDQLRAAGIREAADRVAILRAIEAFYADERGECREPSAPEAACEAMAEAETETERGGAMRENAMIEEGQAECVVCMERACKIIFLPCGHLCCCPECQQPLQMCPMCRSPIERRIKVIQA